MVRGIDVIEDPVPALAEYGGIPIAFQVSEVFDVVADADGGARLEARRDAVVSWARSRGCLQLEVETQNTNVAACRFYAQRGCVLRTVQRGAYPELPAEVQLLWLKDLQA
jgi:hypothetical protein